MTTASRTLVRIHDIVEGWEIEGLGTCPEIDRTNYPDAWREVVVAVREAACPECGCGPWSPAADCFCARSGCPCPPLSERSTP